VIALMLIKITGPRTQAPVGGKDEHTISASLVLCYKTFMAVNYKVHIKLVCFPVRCSTLE
jgi:hypothetical protein